jgi:uncharacterized protein
LFGKTFMITDQMSTHIRQRHSTPPELCAIGVMAKAPRPGFSKTRLCPPLHADAAARLSAAFLRDITENIARASRQTPIASYVAYAPLGHEALFDGHLAPGTSLILANGLSPMPASVEGFGRCLLHAISSMLARGHEAAAVLNSDSPTLPTALLERAARELAVRADRMILGPAEDGGYYLLGMRKAHAHLFTDIAWSTDSVADKTRLRARELGLDIVELPQWYDVDDEAALCRLMVETERSVEGNDACLRPYNAPFTVAALSTMRLEAGRLAAG